MKRTRTTYNQMGEVVAVEEYDVDPDTQRHEDNLASILSTIAALEALDRDWATLTAAQRGEAMRTAVRATAALARRVTGRFDRI